MSSIPHQTAAFSIGGWDLASSTAAIVRVTHLFATRAPVLLIVVAVVHLELLL
jgi:hypothetical protein